MDASQPPTPVLDEFTPDQLSEFVKAIKEFLFEAEVSEYFDAVRWIRQDWLIQQYHRGQITRQALEKHLHLTNNIYRLIIRIGEVER